MPLLSCEMLWQYSTVCLAEIKWNEVGWPVPVTKNHRVVYENRKPFLRKGGNRYVVVL